MTTAESTVRPRDGITRDRRWRSAILPVVGVIAAFFGAKALVGLIITVLSFFGVRYTGDDNVFAAAAALLFYGLLSLFILGVPKLLKTWSGRISYPKLFGLTRVLWWRDILYAAAAAMVYFAILYVVEIAVAALVPGFNASQAQDTGFARTLGPATALLVFFSLVVLAPVVEEIIFRGYLFGTLQRSLRPWVAALVTSAMFGAAHLQWNVGIDVFLLSLTSCFLRYKTGALWASILLHTIKNGIAFYLLYIAGTSIL